MNLIASLHDAFILLFTGDAALWTIIWTSLKTSFISLIIATPFTVVVGYWLATNKFIGRRFVIWILQASLSMPTVLVGLLLYMLLSRQGALGVFEMLFSQSGIIAGQIMIALPVLIAFTLSAVQAADVRLAETAVSLGAPRWRVMLTVLYEVRFGVMAAIINGFGRAISEVGCAMMVGGNIQSATRTITTAIALETSKGEFTQGIALGIVLVFLALLINAALMFLQGEAQTAGVAQ